MKRLETEAKPTETDFEVLGEEIKQIHLKIYPKSDVRCFRDEWFKICPWLEFSAAKYVVYCYECRQFNSNRNKEQVFTRKRFQNWKMPLVKTKDFQNIPLQTLIML